MKIYSFTFGAVLAAQKTINYCYKCPASYFSDHTMYYPAAAHKTKGK